MKVAIRADGGPQIGYGHLVRTGALAQELLQKDDDVIYITRTPNAVSEELSDEIIVRAVKEHSEIEKTVEIIREESVDIIFTDSFAVDTSYQKRLSETDAKVIVRHNYRNYTVCCDALIYGDFHAPKVEYEWLSKKPAFYLGPDYALLREMFRKAAQEDIMWRAEPERAIILMGGSDVNNTTPAVMEAFSGFDGIVDVVIGPGYSNESEIKEVSKQSETSFELYHTPENMAFLLKRADLAVSAVGGTVFELLATRTPFVGIPQASNQRQRAEALREQDLALIIDEREEIPDGIDILLGGDTRWSIFNNMKGIVDGRGTERVYDCFLSMGDY